MKPHSLKSAANRNCRIWFRIASGIEDSHGRTTAVFIRSLAGVYAVAFASLAVQVRGLIGKSGLLPAEEYLRAVFEVIGSRALMQVPTVFWLDASDAFLEGACWAGAGFSLLIALGILQGPLLLVNWLLYLSFVSVGQVFLHYQWDVLLLETGFLAIWMSPWTMRAEAPATSKSSLLLLWLLRWLLFRLMFSSGWVKLSTDEVWRDLSALDFHYWTQPLPIWTSWWLHWGPEFSRQGCVALTLLIECLGPWLIFLGRKSRKSACVLFAIFQLGLIATGNFGFFNLLSLTLCITLWSESPGGSRRSHAGPPVFSGAAIPPKFVSAILDPRRIRRGSEIVLAVLLLLLSFASLLRLERPGLILPYPADALERNLAPFHLVNRYGLFADMTTQRPEIALEISSDGKAWIPVSFRWKPGPLNVRPQFTGFHMPRLDWQMWFEGLRYLSQDQYYMELGTPLEERHYYPDRWFLNLTDRIKAPPNSATELLRLDSRDLPARFIRAKVYRYRFSTPEERKISGNWWEKEFRGMYLPMPPGGDM